MAFMQVQNGGSGEGSSAERLPILSYNAKAGRMFTMDRVQDSGGAWSTIKTDVTMAQPAFAIDFGSLEVGWIHFPEGAGPSFIMVPHGKILPARPPSPGTDAKGKVLQYKQGFRVKVIGQAIGGVRELAGNSASSIEGLNNLHTDYEASSEAASGMIPLVKMINVIPIRSGQGENFMPVYAIQQWVARPDVLGARTVSPPSGGARTSAPPPQSNHVPPPQPKQPEPEKALADSDVPF